MESRKIKLALRNSPWSDELSCEEVTHGNLEDILCKNILGILEGDLCDREIKCDWCEALTRRMESRMPRNLHLRIWLKGE